MEKPSNLFEKFGFCRVAVVSLAAKSADVQGLQNEIHKTLLTLQKEKVQLAVFPELCLTSYSCGDLFFQKPLLQAATQSLIDLKKKSAELSLHFVVGLPFLFEDQIYNLAAYVAGGKIWGLVPKINLPNQNEFYEKRWFQSGKDLQNRECEIDAEKIPLGWDLLFSVKNAGSPHFLSFTFGIEICEDLWAPTQPSNNLALAGAKVIINLSASSEWVSKKQNRTQLVQQQSNRLSCAYLYSGAGFAESSSDVVFSGHSLIAEDGNILASLPGFQTQTQFCIADLDLEKLTQKRIKNKSFFEKTSSQIFRKFEVPAFFSFPDFKDLRHLLFQNPYFPFSENALAEKSAACQEVAELAEFALLKRIAHVQPKTLVLGISAGLDSTLTLLLCVLALKKLPNPQVQILPVSMPGLATSEKTNQKIKALCQALALEFQVIDLSFSLNQHFQDIGQNPNEQDITFENAQARERTQILMDLANKHQGMVIGTSDLSEIALGFSTYNGDQTSMYHLIGGIPKTIVREMVFFFSEQENFSAGREILKEIAQAAITPELLPVQNQKEQNTEEILGPYVLHDFFLYFFYLFGFTPEKIFHLAHLAFQKKFSQAEILRSLKIFYQRLIQNQFKRSAMPDAPKIFSVSLSSRADFRIPSDTSLELWSKELENLTFLQN